MSLSNVTSFFANQWQATLLDWHSGYRTKALVTLAVLPLFKTIATETYAKFSGKPMDSDSKSPSLKFRVGTLLFYTAMATCAFDPFRYSRVAAGILGGLTTVVHAAWAFGVVK